MGMIYAEKNLYLFKTGNGKQYGLNKELINQYYKSYYKKIKKNDYCILVSSAVDCSTNDTD